MGELDYFRGREVEAEEKRKLKKKKRGKKEGREERRAERETEREKLTLTFGFTPQVHIAARTGSSWELSWGFLHGDKDPSS